MDLKSFYPHLTAILASYAALLSTFNFIREYKKGQLKIKVSVEEGVFGDKRKPSLIFTILNQSFFKIEISDLYLSVFATTLDQEKLIDSSPDVFSRFSILPDPVSIESRMSIRKSYETFRANFDFRQLGLTGRIKIQPFIEAYNKRFCGKPIFYVIPPLVSKK